MKKKFNTLAFEKRLSDVIPVKTGIQNNREKSWIPASAGMTTLNKMIYLIRPIFKQIN